MGARGGHGDISPCLYENYFSRSYRAPKYSFALCLVIGVCRVFEKGQEALATDIAAHPGISDYYGLHILFL